MKTKCLFIVTTCLLVIFNSASAQITGFRAGANIANLLDKDDDYVYSDEYKSRTGINLGLTLAVPISDNLHFETGAFYSNKGFQYEVEEMYEGSLMEVSAVVKTQYIDIPLTMKSIYDLGSNHIFLTYGFYAGIGVSGKMELSARYQGESHSETLNILWGPDDQDHFKGFDFGLNAGAGANLDGFIIEARYGHGLANISPTRDNGAVFRNRVISVLVGFQLSKKNAEKEEFQLLK